MTIDNHWSTFVERLNGSINIAGDYNNFLNWDVIKETMFVGDESYINIELNKLLSIKDDNRWIKAIKENDFGNPRRYLYYKDSSSNLIHHAYHIYTFEKYSKRKITDYDTIFEFGGGYGSMCRLIYQLNFRKEYVICDLPEFINLQKIYLDTLKIPYKHIIEEDIYNFNFLGKKLFIATWSLSETPTILMDNVLNKVKNFDSFIIAFHKDFVNGNNIEYFNKFKNQNSQINWKMIHITFMGDHYYLIGDRNV